PSATTGSSTNDTEQLLPAVGYAISQRKLVVAQGNWCVTDPVALLPFRLHGDWCDRFPTLPLGANFSMVPFTPHDWAVAEQNLFDPALVKAARINARLHRSEEARPLRGDYVLADWEDGYSRHRAELQGAKLPPCSFLSVDAVYGDGSVRRSGRHLLGRYAVR